MKDTPIIQNAVFACIVAALTVVIYRVLRERNRDRASLINFDDLLLDHATGKMSKPAAVMFASLAVTSLVILYQTFKGTLTDLSFGAYLAAWVAPTVANIIVGDPKPPAMPAGPTTQINAEKVEVKQ